jgi:hypothetical protein
VGHKLPSVIFYKALNTFYRINAIDTDMIKVLSGIFLAVVATSFSASTHLPSLEEQSGVPFGYFDTEASGAMKAQQDLALGVVKYAVYGLPMKGYVDKLVANGVTPLLMGCLAGGAGSAFWTGYNTHMESRFPELISVPRLT